MNLTLTQEQFTALVSLARRGATLPMEIQVLENYVRSIENANGLKRYLLLVQWQEMDVPLPPTTDFPEVWPPELRLQLERTDRAIAKADVLAVLAKRAKKPIEVMVTRDLTGSVGWAKLDDFFIT